MRPIHTDRAPDVRPEYAEMISVIDRALAELRAGSREHIVRHEKFGIASRRASISIVDADVAVEVDGRRVLFERAQLQRILRNALDAEAAELSAAGWKPVGRGWWRFNGGPSVQRLEALRFVREAAAGA